MGRVGPFFKDDRPAIRRMLHMAGKKTKTRGSSTLRDEASQWFNFQTDSYLERTARPICSLVFLVPFIVIYELGTIFCNTDILTQTQERVVAFVWLQEFLNYLGIAPRFALAAPPLVVVVILIAWHMTSRKPWHIHLGDLPPMFLESVLLAIPLIVFSLFLNSRTVAPPTQVSVAVAAPTAGSDVGPNRTATPGGGRLTRLAVSQGTYDRRSRLAPDLITGIGAGIYEELVFRLILVCLLMLVFQDILRLPWKNAIMFSVVVSAVLFSLHHHIVVVNGRVVFGDVFSMAKFGFRTIAGVYFAALFAIRGFGITAATHACYDIIATILNTFWLGD